MKIYVGENLSNLKDELKKRGYTVAIDGDNSACDVIICNLKNEGLSHMSQQYSYKREGTLIIDNGSKTIDEIEYIINNRVYSSII